MIHHDNTPAAYPTEGYANVHPEASGFLAISRACVYALMREGKLSYIQIGRSRRIPWKSLHAFAAAAFVQGSDRPV